MYFPVNDQELLYLIKDGNEAARRMLYTKYEHLIPKLFKDVFHIRQIMFADFKQECLMCLEKAIKTYRTDLKCSFYTFYLLIVRRTIYKLYKKSNLFFQEQHQPYDQEKEQEAYPPESYLLKILYHELDFEGEVERCIFEDCIIRGEKITVFAKKRALDYPFVYKKYKKIKEKAEKILTNYLV